MKNLNPLFIISIVAFTILTGCATTGKMNEISVGMTKGQVIDAIGDPESTAATGNMEIFRYNLRNQAQAYWGGSGEYFVRFIDGKVESYGRMGDFNSTKDPAPKVDVNVKQQ